jgi:hypothetical protein
MVSALNGLDADGCPGDPELCYALVTLPSATLQKYSLLKCSQADELADSVENALGCFCRGDKVGIFRYKESGSGRAAPV